MPDHNPDLRGAIPYGDDPIQEDSQDLIGRTKLAAVLADEIAGMPARYGAVVGITGPWGSGKTSVMNLTAARLRERHPEIERVVEFNPWLFAGAEELASNLLSELAAQLRHNYTRGQKVKGKVAQAATTLAKYSAALDAVKVIPVVGVAKGAVDASIVGVTELTRDDTSLNAQRQDVVDALGRLNGRVVVLVDDIDRLNRKEIRDLFRTVRLTASFPNVIYLLCLDRRVVENALGQNGLSGRDYLAKILTITCTIPALSGHRAARLFTDALNIAIKDLPTGPIHQGRFADVFQQVIAPLLETMRDVKRVLASLPITVRMMNGEVNFEDLVALETLRTLAPALHDEIRTCAAALTNIYQTYDHRDEQMVADIQRFATGDAVGESLTHAVLRTLFPVGYDRLTTGVGPTNPEAWLKDRRVAHLQGLSYYLSQDLGPGEASLAQVQPVLDALGNLTALRAGFAATPNDVLENLLSQVEPHLDQLDLAQVAATVAAIADLYDQIPARLPSTLDPDGRFSVTRPVLRLLRRLAQSDPQQVTDVVRHLIENHPSLYAAFTILSHVGHRPNVGERLVTEAAAQELKDALRRRVDAATPEQLATTRRLHAVLWHTLRPSPDATEPVLPALMDPMVARALLLVSVTSDRERLTWEILVPLYGGESRVREIVNLLEHDRASNDADDDLAHALSLAERHLTGELPALPE